MKIARLVPALILSVALAAPVGAKGREVRAGLHPDWCGTRPNLHKVVRATSEWNQRRLLRQRLLAERSGPVVPALAPEVENQGNVAVIYDDGSILIDENLFDGLKGFRVKRLKKIDGVKILGFGGAVKANLGDKVELPDDGSTEIDFPGNVTFPFYGERHSSFFLNSDGNITFGVADLAISARDVSRFADGPPRIAPFFRDLDPSAAEGDGGVYVRFIGKKTQVTWYQVPEFRSSVVEPLRLVTVQVTMTKKGKIIVAFGEVESDSAIIGVSPGSNPALDLLDFSEDLPTGPSTGAIAENFSEEEQLDEAAISKAFYSKFRDDYTHVIVYFDFRHALLGRPTVTAYHFHTRQQTKGIGLPTFNNSRFYGSRGTLESFVVMGRLEQYDTRPHRTIIGESSSMGVIGHEVGHRWLTRVQFIDADGNESDDLLGRQQGHWSFHYDSDASFVEGNDLQDNGDGTFTTVAAEDTYGPVDRYLMGMIPPEEVGPLFYVKNGGGPSSDANPEVGITFPGNRTDFTIDDIIAAEGVRKPNSKKAPKHFNMAFILLVRDGEELKAGSVDQVDTYRQEWPGLFADSTGGIGSVDTTLNEK